MTSRADASRRLPCHFHQWRLNGTSFIPRRGGSTLFSTTLRILPSSTLDLEWQSWCTMTFDGFPVTVTA